MLQWNSLYLPHPDAASLIETLRTLLTAPDYAPYDPFGALPAMSYPHTLKVFVAPPAAGWTRVIVSPEAHAGALDAVIGTLSHRAPCLVARLSADTGASAGASAGEISVYHDGALLPLPDALHPYLKPGVSAEMLDDALNRRYTGAAGQQSAVVPAGTLSPELRSMASRLNPRQAKALFSRMSKQLVGREQREAAEALLVSNAPDWESAGGQRLAAVMACLTVPDAWHTPDFVAVRDAYQAHSRRHRSPNARLFPGEAEAMAALPDALTYTPLFAGVLA